MSSWAPYVDQMIGKGVMFSGIYTKEGAVCAQSTNLNLSAQEITTLYDYTQGGSEKANRPMFVNGAKCIMTAFSPEGKGFVTGKTKDGIYNGEKILYHCECTNTLIVICGMTGSGERECKKIAGDTAQYLTQQNY